ncbi:hypothetical protein JI735_30760 [Paenibacillus sonchi]|uniref:Uncharacterized protein n=2 Tax=Paenibacillus sonchi TaxID=373687 RepID=A0A974PC63_9BACL|nr:hypothetical protein [Paenibacillus sonchi]QQZ60786.1 hypothetical protein JI735_30760 [Paenibacillus sonchi]
MDPSGHFSVEPYDVHELRSVLDDAIAKNLNKGSKLYQAYHDKIWERYGFASFMKTNQYNYLFGLLTGTSAYKNSAGNASWAREELITAFYEENEAEYLAFLALGAVGRFGGGNSGSNRVSKGRLNQLPI